MQITAKNLEQKITDNGNIILLRTMADGKPHKHQLRRTETIAYSAPIVYNTAEDVMSDVDAMNTGVGALVHLYPNRPSQRFVVKYGEIL